MAISTVLLSNTFNEWRLITNQIIAQINTLGTNSTIAITGGSINGTTVGASTPSTGVFTTLRAISSLTLTGATITLDDNSISGNKISGGTIDNAMVELSAAPTQVYHATRKDYVDGQITTTRDEIMFLTLTLG